MKNTILILCALFFISCKAQTVVNITTYNQGENNNKYFKDIDNNYQNFVGIWENTSNNITFRLILWKETHMPLLNEYNSYVDEIYGKYLIIQDAGTPNEQILYNSVKYFPQSGQTSTTVMYAMAYNNISFGSTFIDFNANNGTGVLYGSFGFEIINLGSTPLQAHWQLESDLTKIENYDTFVVPTDCILTKVD
ncbi:hypothetical protein NHF50_14640 [Flavobacterium sp. NRK F10]|uniref:DUF6705 family protein n=1 Tax=Flavobacterium sp. NRK F10 TaxID=2954931 RepID=UPI002090DA81|nr:DUF6705 family protein [Flavobacterium sp. NRK F10]MCO6176286.1 hypothetical protein [Flavobacterium sp. NRK F10]